MTDYQTRVSVRDVSNYQHGSRQIRDSGGRVALVGAGPGDPDLLTVRALREIQLADVVIVDNLVSDAIRQLIPDSACSIHVGKAKGKHSASQSEINRLLIDQALLGKRVCRLKGGDAFVFGRGGEEMLALREAGIDVELVPGITAATGCSGYAGIPLTHRGISQGCTLITAHAEKSLDIDWAALAALNHTLVIYMGLTKAGFVSKRLIEGGLASSTPVAVVEKGCHAGQRTVTGTLSELENLARQYQVQSPALLIIGEVVSLSESLHWFGELAQSSQQSQQIQQPQEKVSA